MATPMSSTVFLAQLKRWKVPYQEHAGWATHNRNSRGAWGPMYGVMLHHTGDDSPDTASYAFLRSGSGALPGPLCQWGMDDRGVAQLVGWGRCNHAGGGDPKVLAVVKAETYRDYPPAPQQHTGSAGSVDGNAHFYGQETMFSGKKKMTAEAYASTVRIFAAICAYHGWSADSCIGHKEWSNWKSDPGQLDMKVFRADVTAALKAGPVVVVKPPVPPPLPKPVPKPVPVPVPPKPAPVPVPPVVKPPVPAPPVVPPVPPVEKC